MKSKQPFETIVAAHGQTVLRVCRAVLGLADADDAWSETFLSAMKAYPDLPADANVQAWLVTIGHRKAIDITRAAARQAIPVAVTPDTATNAAARGGDLDLDVDLTDAMAKLPAKQNATRGDCKAEEALSRQRSSRTGSGSLTGSAVSPSRAGRE